MKRLISLIVFLFIVIIIIGCFATMTPEERKETYDLRKTAGESTFVGDLSPDQRAAFMQIYTPSHL
jgi:hypothetical protein